MDSERIQAHHQAGTITDKEHAALELNARGMSTRAISLALSISRGAVRDRIKNGLRKIADQKEEAA